MKTKQFLLLLIITIVFTSCNTKTYFYQVYKAVPTQKIVEKNNSLVYEDENCKVSYNLWDENGNIGFEFYNKTDKNIYLNLDECFFILNGVSNSYYQNRVFTNSKSSGTIVSKSTSLSNSITGINIFDYVQTNKISLGKSLGFTSSTGSSVAYNEEKIVCIPSFTRKTINEFSINDILFRDCDLYKYPSKRQNATKTFSKEDSPLIFSNRIAYTVGKTDKLIKFENEFYVAEISNASESSLTERKRIEYCNQKTMEYYDFIKISSPDKFYIRYFEGNDTWKH